MRGAVVGYDVLRGVMEAAGRTVGVSLERVSPLRADDDEPAATVHELTPAQEESVRVAVAMGYRNTAALAVLATAVAPIGVVRTLVVPLALLLPLSAWSALGTRERRHRTTELVFVGSRPTRLLGATYASGVAIGLLVSVPAPVRFSLSGMDGALVGWLAAVLSLPAIALALGVWTGRSKSFEIAYLTAWYLGPVNGLGALDYVAARPSTASAGIPVVYLALTVVALGVALVGRRRQ